MSKNLCALSLTIGLAMLAAGCGKDEPPPPPPPEPAPPPSSPFQHVDFHEGLSADEIEAAHPLTDEGRAELTPENVQQLAQWQIDQLYARLDGGAIPDGPWQGRFFFAEGSGATSLGDAFEGLPSRIVDRLVDKKLERLTRVGESLWKGKVFFKEEGVLRNMVDHEQIVERIFDVDPDKVMTEEIDGRTVALLFPAKLSCGESLKDPRRESVIIDYAESETVPGYLPEIDWLAAKDGLAIRDEIRFVRPGFYLGLAYFLDQKLLLTFTLHNAEAQSAGVVPEPECSDGRDPLAGADDESADDESAEH